MKWHKRHKRRPASPAATPSRRSTALRTLCCLGAVLACGAPLLADTVPPPARTPTAAQELRPTQVPADGITFGPTRSATPPAASTALAEPTGLFGEAPEPAPVPPSQPEYQLGAREGGETCADAIPITALPFSDLGNTCDNVNDYDEVCPLSGSTARDVVYSFTPAVNYTVNISLCNDGTDYDTKLYIYQDTCPGTRVACNEDACNSPQFPSGYLSRLMGVELAAGHTYYIIVDGYGTACGNYHITMDGVAACAVCPEWGVPEGESICSTGWVDTQNGGCNFSPHVFQPITCGQTICGESGWYVYGTEWYRDTDWYEIVLTEPTELVWEIQARFKSRGYIIDGSNGCGGTLLATGTAGYCGTATMRAPVGPGTYWLWVAPRNTDPNEVCGSDYVATLTCNATPTCAADYVVTAPGTWASTTYNAGSQCAALPSEDHVYEVHLPYSSRWRITYDASYGSYMLVGTKCCDYDLANDFAEVEVVAGGTIWVALEAQTSVDSGPYTLTIVDVNGELECPPGGIPEGEPDCEVDYDDTFNVGCQGNPPVFSTIACGDTVCGSYGTFPVGSVGYRDTDWYQVDVTEPSILTWTLVGEARTAGYIIQPGPNGCADYEVIAYADGDPQETIVLEAHVQAGTYWVWAGTAAFAGVPCGENYIGHLDCEPWPNVVDAVVTAPGTWTGNTCNAGDDCYLWPSPDKVYQIELPYPAIWRVDLCGSDYNTRLFVGTTFCSDDLGSNDNYCGYQSAVDLTNVGGTVYATIEGYNATYCGAYVLNVTELAPFPDCPPGATPEGEPVCGPDYDDHYNGGCDVTPAVFQPIANGQTICGEAGVFPFGSTIYRDVDYFVLDVPEMSRITWRILAEYATELYILNAGSGDCTDSHTVIMRTGSAYEWSSVTSSCVPAGQYWLVVAPRFFDDLPCGSRWIGTATYEPCPGACCLPDAPYCTEMLLSECETAGGIFHGPNTVCAFDQDCDANGRPDFCDFAYCDGSAWCSDCNGNGRLDICDVPAPAGTCTAGCSDDCQADGVPDECQMYPYDETLLWDNGPVITHPAPMGCSGGAVSALQTNLGLSSYGFGASRESGNVVADDFELPSRTILHSAVVYAYATGIAPPSINGIFVRLYSGAPNAGGTLIYGSATVSRLISAEPAGVWRAPDYSLTACNRGLTRCVVDLGHIEVPAGTYWLAFSCSPSADASPWVPAVTYLGDTGKEGANALWYNGTSLEWTPLVDGGTAHVPQDIPFQIVGLPLPPVSDCNNNGTLDECDIATGTSQDVDNNGVPDECELLRGDTNCDGFVNFGDINPFVTALINPTQYAAQYPGCDILHADMDGNGSVGFSDINPFVARLIGS